MKKRKVNGGIIRIDDKLLLNWLRFKGGHIHKVYKPDEYFDVSYICLLVEHPDLPEVKLGEKAPEVIPIYSIETDAKGNIISMQRKEPPVGGENGK